MSVFVPLSIKEILQLYPADIDNDKNIKNIKNNINHELRKIHFNKKDLKAYENIKYIIHKTSNLIGKKQWYKIRHNIKMLVLKKFNINHFIPRPLSGDELDKLFSLSTYQTNYIDSIYKIEQILTKIYLDQDFDNFILHKDDDLDNYVGIQDYISQISKILLKNKRVGDEKIILDIKSTVIDYFNTQYIKTSSIKQIKNIIWSEDNEDVRSFKYSDIILIKKDFDKILSKIRKEEFEPHLLDDFTDFYNHMNLSSFRRDIVKIFGCDKINKVYCVIYHILTFII